MGTSGAAKDMLDQVLGELAALREENQRLTARMETLEGRDCEAGLSGTGKRAQLVDPDHDGETPAEAADGGNRHLSRRGVFKLAGAAAAGAAGASLLAAEPAGATTGTMMFGEGNFAGADGTSLGSSNVNFTLDLFNDSSGAALFANDVSIGTGEAVHAELDNNSNGANAITAQTVGSGYAIHGLQQNIDATNAAVSGTHSGPGSGVDGFSAHGAGVNGTSGGSYGLQGEGALAPLFLVAHDTPAHPTAGNHTQGEIYVDDGGGLWYCIAVGSPGSWRRLAGPGTAGALTVLPSPVRVYDSRSKDGPLAGGAERTVSLALGTDGTTPAVPAGAIASLFTLTIVDTGTNGFLAAFSNAVSWPGTSNINWFQVGTVEATSVTSAVDASAQIKLHCGGTPTDFVIDATGYYE
jgi:hypothetical protein